MGMFNQAKQNSFATEVKEIYKQAQQQWISDSMTSTSAITYYRVDGVSKHIVGTGTAQDGGINLTGRTQLDYWIVIDKAGKVTDYYATDGSYQYAFKGTAGIEVENIGDESKIADSDKKLAADSATKVLKISSSGNVLNNVVVQVSTLSTGELDIDATNGVVLI